MQVKQLFVLAVLVCVVSSLTPAKRTIGGCFPTPMYIKFRPDLADPTSNSTINLSGGDDPDSGYSFDALLPIKWEFNERQDSITISAKDKNGKLQTFRYTPEEAKKVIFLLTLYFQMANNAVPFC